MYIMSAAVDQYRYVLRMETLFFFGHLYDKPFCLDQLCMKKVFGSRKPVL